MHSSSFLSCSLSLSRSSAISAGFPLGPSGPLDRPNPMRFDVFIY